MYYWCHMCRTYIPDDIPQAEDWVRYHSTCLLDSYSDWGTRMTEVAQSVDPVRASAHLGHGEDVPDGYDCPVDDLTLLSMAAHSIKETA